MTKSRGHGKSSEACVLTDWWAHTVAINNLNFSWQVVFFSSRGNWALKTQRKRGFYWAISAELVNRATLGILEPTGKIKVFWQTHHKAQIVLKGHSIWWQYIDLDRDWPLQCRLKTYKKMQKEYWSVCCWTVLNTWRMPVTNLPQTKIRLPFTSKSNKDRMKEGSWETTWHILSPYLMQYGFSNRWSIKNSVFRNH